MVDFADVPPDGLCPLGICLLERPMYRPPPIGDQPSRLSLLGQVLAIDLICVDAHVNQRARGCELDGQVEGGLAVAFSTPINVEV